MEVSEKDLVNPGQSMMKGLQNFNDIEIPTMESMPQMNQMPMGQMPMGQMPMGQMPMGQMPMGQMPMGQMPMGQMATGQQMPMMEGVDNTQAMMQNNFQQGVSIDTNDNFQMPQGNMQSPLNM